MAWGDAELESVLKLNAEATRCEAEGSVDTELLPCAEVLVRDDAEGEPEGVTVSLFCGEVAWGEIIAEDVTLASESADVEKTAALDTLGEPLKDASEVGDGVNDGEEEPLEVALPLGLSLIHHTRDQNSIKSNKFIVYDAPGA